MRIVALLARTYEERFIGACDRAPGRPGHRRLPDRQRVDRPRRSSWPSATWAGLVGIESFPRDGAYPGGDCSSARTSSPSELDADWFMHLDADEFRLSPRGAHPGGGVRRGRSPGLQRGQLPGVHLRPDPRGSRPRPSALPGDDAMVLPIPACFPRPAERVEAAGATGRSHDGRRPPGRLPGTQDVPGVVSDAPLPFPEPRARAPEDVERVYDLDEAEQGLGSPAGRTAS